MVARVTQQKYCIFYSGGMFSLSFMSSALFKTVWNSAKMLAWKNSACNLRIKYIMINIGEISDIIH